MFKIKKLIIISILLVANCTGLKEIHKKDNLGRVISVLYFDGNELDRMEEITYYGNSHNPSKIVYKKKVGMDYIPLKEEVYKFNDNNLVRLSFYIYKNFSKIKTGMIKYYYAKNKPSRIEYYSYIKSMKKMFIFGLDQYKYRRGKIYNRRIIEYEFNPENKKPMQIGHYVIYYNKGKIISMKLSIMDKKSKKIIEKKVKNIDLVNGKVEDIEEYFIRKSRGKEFLQK